MNDIKRILENQKEVRYLAYFVIQDDRSGEITLHIYAADISKKYKFKDENHCLSKLVDILSELKRLEIWSLSRQEKANAKKR